MSAELEIVVAAALFGGWLVLFFLGLTYGGAIHLLPLTAIALAWRGARRLPHGSTIKEKR